MRVLLVNSATPSMWGGGEKWFSEAAAWFHEQGHEIAVVARPGSRQLRAIEDLGLTAIAFDFGGDYDPIASWHASRLLAHHRPSVVLVNFNKDAWLFGRGAKLMRIPVVARHGLTLFKPKVVHRIVYRFHMDHVVVNARSIRDEYAALGFDTHKISVILNGVKSRSTRPGALRQELGLGPEVPLVIAAGRMDPQKRHDRFVRIAEILGKRFTDAHFAILGDGPRADDIAALARKSSLGDRLHLPGFVEDYAAVAGDADLYLLTSRNEGSPNVLLETMSAGVAVIAFDVGAVPEILEPFPHLVVSEGDEEAMAARAVDLLSDRDHRDDTAKALATHCHERLSYDHSMQQYESLLTDLA